MHAKEKPDLPVATQETLKEYDAFLFGIPTRYGNMPAQWKVWDLALSRLFSGRLVTFRHSGTTQANCGPLARLQENTQVSSCPLEILAAAKRPLG